MTDRDDSAIGEHRQEWVPSSFLARLGDTELRALVAGREVASLAAGEDLVVEGAADQGIYLLISARAKVTARVGSAGTALLAVRVSGDVIGEIALVDGGRRSATVTITQNNSLVVRVPGHEFLSVTNGSPAAARLLQATLADKLRSANQRRIDISAFKVPARVARVLAELAGKYGHPGTHHASIRVLAVGLSKSELATMVGAKETAVSEALAELKRAGILDWGYRSVTINDMEALRVYGVRDPR